MTSPGNIPRIHLYGASNLWLSRGAALTAVRRRFEGPLKIGLACGPGRSYGLRAGNPLARYLPLREVEFPSPAPPTLAVLSDVGNDIVYSQPPDTILVWVGELAGRLESQGAEVLLTGLPLESLRALPGWLFSALRSLYYAGQKLTQGELMQRLLDLEGGLQTLARERGYLFLPTQPEWYGFDRFHLRSKSYSACWEGWLERLQPDLGFQGQPTWRQLWQLKPQTYWYRGRPRQAAGEYDEVLPLTRVWVR